jgi:predicted transcriptional regulator
MKLKDYITENCINIRLFAKKIGVSVTTLYSIFEGHDIRLSTALSIEDATKKQVTCRDMLPTVTRGTRTKSRNLPSKKVK